VSERFSARVGVSLCECDCDCEGVNQCTAECVIENKSVEVVEGELVKEPAEEPLPKDDQCVDEDGFAKCGVLVCVCMDLIVQSEMCLVVRVRALLCMCFCFCFCPFSCFSVCVCALRDGCADV
jgi:hypothetical protein